MLDQRQAVTGSYEQASLRKQTWMSQVLQHVQAEGQDYALVRVRTPTSFSELKDIEKLEWIAKKSVQGMSSLSLRRLYLPINKESLKMKILV